MNIIQLEYENLINPWITLGEEIALEAEAKGKAIPFQKIVDRIREGTTIFV
jgi:hypothetical protein